LHDSLQIDDTSLTHWLSLPVLQQNPSWAQISVAQLSQDAVSLPPVAQIACAQVPPPHDWVTTPKDRRQPMIRRSLRTSVVLTRSSGEQRWQRSSDANHL
jgi:hypothetical protein